MKIETNVNTGDTTNAEVASKPKWKRIRQTGRYNKLKTDIEKTYFEIFPVAWIPTIKGNVRESMQQSTIINFEKITEYSGGIFSQIFKRYSISKNAGKPITKFIK